MFLKPQEVDLLAGSGRVHIRSPSAEGTTEQLHSAGEDPKTLYTQQVFTRKLQHREQRDSRTSEQEQDSTAFTPGVQDPGGAWELKPKCLLDSTNSFSWIPSHLFIKI